MLNFHPKNGNDKDFCLILPMGWTPLEGLSNVRVEEEERKGLNEVVEP